ncbi:MAG: alkane 1-monooxygenase [Bauldia sp.]|nr:alkane 1-monooxygenase [Bauldia sp.]
MKALVDQGRFALLPAMQLIGLLTIAVGGPWLWLGGALLLGFNLLLDDVGADYLEIVESPSRAYLDAMLYASVPLVVLLTAGLLFYTASPGTIMADLASGFGIVRQGAAWWVDSAGLVFSVGVLGGFAAGSFAHELLHRPTRGEWLMSQSLLARCLHAAFALEHIHGHHVGVGTPHDISTAPRGLGFWRYLPRTYVGAIRGAARIEADRMRRMGLPWYAPRNRFLQGVLLELAMLVAVAIVAGRAGLGAYLITAAIGVLIIELGNYVAHYGLVRASGRPVLPRHSWNAPRFFSSSVMVNAPRHSHHHRSATTRYWDLAVLDGGAIYPYGTAVMSVIALVPPLWFRVMQPHLDDWDARQASSEELEIIRRSADAGRVRAPRGAPMPGQR